MSLSIRWRLAIWIAVALILTLTAVFLTLRFTLTGILQSDLRDQLSRDQSQMAAQIAVAGSVNSASLQNIVQSRSFLVVVRDVNGRQLAHSPGLTVESLAALTMTPGEVSRVIGGDNLERSLEIGDQPVRVRISRLTTGRQVLGLVEIGENDAAIGQVTRALEVIFAIFGLVAAVVAFAVGYWLSRSALKPIDDVTAVAREIEASDLSRRIGASKKPEEVQRLADTFDGMLERLSRAFEQQRNFVMDMSHELRTPLTALRGNLDVLLMEPGLDEDLRCQMERMSREVGRLIRLTSNLLYLAHVDAGRGIDRRPVALDDLCFEVQREAKNLRPDVKLRLGREDQVTVMGDRDLLKQLLLNLVENGMKYSPSGGEVSLSLDHEDSWARLVVQDTGPGIPPQDIPHIFDRHYRGADSQRKGAGIGLAICQWVASSHGGRIEVSSELGKGSTFTVHLPAADGSPAGGV